MFDPIVIEKLKERYKELHPLLVHRSVDYATSLGELFDILETVPKEMPLVWDHKARCWTVSDDISQIDKFQA